MLTGNYGQIEAEALPISLMDMTSRAALNLAFAWWMERIDPKEWDTKYKHLFTSGQSIRQYVEEENKRMRKAEKGESAQLNIPKRDDSEKKKVTEQDLSSMFGRMSGFDQGT